MLGTSSFVEAVEAGTREFLEAKKKDPNRVLLVDITKARKAGIKPFPLVVGKKDFSVRERLDQIRAARRFGEGR